MSQSARIQERFRARLWSRRAAAILYIASAVAYMTWRATIINEDALVLSGMYYASDLIAVLLGALTIFVSWNYRHRVSPPAPKGLSVDVFIPSYREPTDMVRRTLKAAKAIRYPHQTWLLDDSDRPEMKALAEELGCRYLARAENVGAKAGNLNHGLKNSTADFVAVFDADHVPQSHALDATLGFFTDPGVGMVQTPQDYYNTDALQYMNPKRGGLWHDQSFFYNLSQPGRDYWDAASCAGTSVVYRRSALDEIGGIPTETVTEDVHTSLKLQKAGYSVPYLNEPIAYGVAAADLFDYYRTRLRYGHGNIHALRSENVFFCRGLTLAQRISYLFLGLIYLEGWQQLMIFLVPSLALILGWAPFEITIFNVLVVLAFPLWAYLLMQEVGCGFSRYWTAEIYSMMRFPVHIAAATALIGKSFAWRVSRKNVRGRFSLALLAPQIAVLVLSLTAVAVGVYRLQGDYHPGPLVAAVTDRLPDRAAIETRVAALSERAVAAGRQVVAWVKPEEKPVVVAERSSEPGAGPSVAPEAAAPEAATRGATAPGATAPEAAKPATGEAPTAPPTTTVPSTEQPPAAIAPPAAVAPPPVVRPAPPPIDWFQPFTKGYTIDLVLIAGFWALVNALRVIAVIVKVARNASLTSSDYMFRTLTPVLLETASGPRYVVAEQLSQSKAVIGAAPAELSGRDMPASLEALAYLPDGPARLRLTPEEERVRRGRPVSFHVEPLSAADRDALDRGLYATSWHRECRQNDADFVTPLGALGGLFRLRRKDNSQWRPALAFHDDNPEPELALLKRGGELLLLAADEPEHAAPKVVVVSNSGAETRRLLLRQLIDSAPFHDATPNQRRCLRYQTQDLAGAADVTSIRRWLDRRRATRAVDSDADADRAEVV